MFVVCCVFSHTDGNDHGGRRGNTTQALVLWQHFLAYHEAFVALHWAMLIVLKRTSGMVIKIASKFATFVYIVYNRVAK
jgi:hypothetical protein